MDIYEQLAELGLKKKSAAAYLALLKLQKANANQIAKEAAIERTTMYNIMDELVEKQLASKSVSGKRLTYIAESPKRFQNIILKQSGILQQLMPILQGMSGQKDSHPIIKYYETRNGIGKALMDSLDNNKEKLCRDLASVQKIVELIGDQFMNHYIAKRTKLQIRLRSLRSSEYRTKNWYLQDTNKDVLREVRYLDKSIRIDSFIKIYDDTIILISSKKEMLGIVVESHELAHAMKTLFDISWANAKPAN